MSVTSAVNLINDWCMDDALHAEMGGIEMGDIKIILALMFLGAILSDAGLKSVGELVIFISIIWSVLLL